VDGDLAHEIDAREIPADWTTGYVPLQQSKPYENRPKTESFGQGVYHLNPELQDWAFKLTKETPLLDSDRMKESRARYKDTPNARKPPFVLKGDNLASSTFWHGKLLNIWANDWVRFSTNDKGNYVTTAMEDTGTLQSLTFLAQAHKVDLNRVMLLRTASNFDSPPPGMTAADSLAQENRGDYSAFDASVEAAYRVGSKVVHELTDHWSRYENELPGKKETAK